MDYSQTSETSFLSFFYETKLAYNWLTMEGGGGTIFKLIILIPAELSLLYSGKELITLSTDHKYKCYFFSLIRYSFRHFILVRNEVYKSCYQVIFHFQTKLAANLLNLTEKIQFYLFVATFR